MEATVSTHLMKFDVLGLQNVFRGAQKSVSVVSFSASGRCRTTCYVSFVARVDTIMVVLPSAGASAGAAGASSGAAADVRGWKISGLDVRRY